MNPVIPKDTKVKTPEGKGTILYCIINSSFPGEILAYCVELENCDRKRQFFSAVDVEDLNPVKPAKSNVVSISTHKRFKRIGAW